MKATFTRNIHLQIAAAFEAPRRECGDWIILLTEPGRGAFVMFEGAAREALAPAEMVHVETMAADSFLEAWGADSEKHPVEARRNPMREHLQRLGKRTFAVLLLDATTASSKEAEALERALQQRSDVGLDRTCMFIALTPRQVEAQTVAGLTVGTAVVVAPGVSAQRGRAPRSRGR